MRVEVDASGGIVMPGMIDTHRHMWQTAMRGYGADWTLTQYFVWYYLEHGRRFRPEDMRAGNLLARLEALDAGVTTVVDWSHGLQSVDHAEAAVDGLRSTPGRFVLAYGNIQAGPWEWTAQPEVQRFLTGLRDAGDDRLGVQLAFDVTGDPAFPEKAAFEVARELGLPGDDARRRVGRHERRRDPAHARARVHDAPDDVRPRRDARHRLVPAHRGDRRLRLGGDRVRAERGPGIPAHLAGAQVRHPGLTVDGHQCLVERRPLHGDADHTRRGPGPRAPRGPRRRRHRHRLHLRAEHVVDWATRGGARNLGRDDLGRLTPGAKADVVLIKNDHSPVSFPLLNPYGHVAFQAQRGDVHTVLVDGVVVKRDNRLVGADLASTRAAVESTVDYLRSEMGEETWQQGMNPALPEDAAVLDNPYTYTEYKSSSTREARESMFGDANAG